jgi:hypothetical protein
MRDTLHPALYQKELRITSVYEKMWMLKWLLSLCRGGD